MVERRDININRLMQGWPSGDGDGFVIHFFIDTSVRVRYPAQFGFESHMCPQSSID